ncbi:hypothetical protein RJ640_022930 [Escallonia rubra]|uniref:Monocopper oxidase-like protein SKU5 n=1 Tax=Escallonia rubra TaxID=112253 RepID=A0AA88UWI8_9ASTE|nr:hypothetical protein RJ640_022930 [Escallonia rubra]
MAMFGDTSWLAYCAILFPVLIALAKADDIFLEWHVALDTTIQPIRYINQPVITINGMFPGPLINITTNDNVHVNVFNDIDEPLLMTWTEIKFLNGPKNGIQQRLNSWQDGVSGTNCPIQPGKNWTFEFQAKDQIGSFFYFPSLYFHKAGGGFGPIRVNNRIAITVPFPKPEAEYDLLVGDWYQTNFKDVRFGLKNPVGAYHIPPDRMLMNGKGRYMDPLAKTHESFTVKKGKTYRFRVSNAGTFWSINFRIQNHQMLLVETEGSYTNQIPLDSLDVHIGQSYSVIVTADQEAADYYIVASPKLTNVTGFDTLVCVSVLHYENSTTNATGALPKGPDPFDQHFSLAQAKSIRWNLTAGAARPNPQGTFNVSNVTLSQTFILHGSIAEINGFPRYTVNNVSYFAPSTPLKLADNYANGSGVYQLDKYPVHSINQLPVNGTFVVTGNHKGWLEIVFKNELDVMDAWHLDGFGFYVVGFGDGEWTPESRSTYNLYDPVVRSTVQVYPGGWSAVYASLDNPGMWNLRSQHLKNWFLGQELYVRVYDPDPNPAKEQPPPDNLLFCGLIDAPPPPPPPPPTPPPPPSPKPVPAPVPPGPKQSSASTSQIPW